MAEFPIPVYSSLETVDATSAVRQTYPEDFFPNGNYYASPWGHTRYWILGPTTGKKIVLIHGRTMPGAMTFKHIAPSLADKGLNVLVYDIYGRGYSETPKLTPEPTLYAIQLAMLLQHIGWSKVNVAGYSMGGSIAAAFCAWFPHLVDENIAFLAAAGLMNDPRFTNSQTQTKPSAGKFELIPGIPDAKEFEKLQAGSLPGFTEVVKACMSGPLRQTGWAFDTLAKMDKKFLILHGTADQAIPFENAHRIQTIIPQAELLPIEGASHFFVMEVGAADKVADKLLEFFA